MVPRLYSFSLEETDSAVKENMLKHFISAMQDAIELSFPRVTRANEFILQEMERGNVTWFQPEKVEALREQFRFPMVGLVSRMIVKKPCYVRSTTRAHADIKTR